MWIARNKDLSWIVSFIDISEPVRLENVGTWGVMGDFFCIVPNDSPFFNNHFGNLKWEDEPMPVSLNSIKDFCMPLDDDDKLASEVCYGKTKIIPPEGYLIGKITDTDNGMLVEYVKK